MIKFAPLTDRALLQIHGADTISFLQNIITCDVESLKAGEATFGALLTPQGKILFDFFVRRQADSVILDTQASQRDALLQRLMFYKLRAAVTIEKNDTPVFALWARDNAAPALKGHANLYHDPRLQNMGLRLYDSLDLSALQQHGDAPLTEVRLEEWHTHRISLGVPALIDDFASSSTFPHEALMDQFERGGVDFSKGCYVGQEVVSRMQHKSTARNRFIKVAAQQSPPSQPCLPPLGSEIIADGKTVGTMGSSVGPQGLALMRLDRTKAAQQSSHALIAHHEGQEISLNVELPSFTSLSWPE